MLKHLKGQRKESTTSRTVRVDVRIHDQISSAIGKNKVNFSNVKDFVDQACRELIHKLGVK